MNRFGCWRVGHRVWSLRVSPYRTPYLGIQQEAIMAPWGDHPARPGPHPPATLLPELCPGRPSPSPPRLALCQVNSLSVMLKESLPPQAPSPTCPYHRLFTRGPWGLSFHITTTSSTKFSIPFKQQHQQHSTPKSLPERSSTFPPCISSLETQTPPKMSLNRLSIDCASPQRPHPQVWSPPGTMQVPCTKYSLSRCCPQFLSMLKLPLTEFFQETPPLGHL